MTRVSEAVRRETLWVAAWTLGLTVAMHIVFIIIGQWGWDVLWGSLLGCAAAIGCFFWLGLTVQKAVGQEEKIARGLFQRSQFGRLLIQGGMLALGFGVEGINGWAVLIPLMAPPIAMHLRPLWKKGMDADPSAAAVPSEEPSGEPGEAPDAGEPEKTEKEGDALD